MYPRDTDGKSKGDYETNEEDGNEKHRPDGLQPSSLIGYIARPMITEQRLALTVNVDL